MEWYRERNAQTQSKFLEASIKKLGTYKITPIFSLHIQSTGSVFKNVHGTIKVILKQIFSLLLLQYFKHPTYSILILASSIFFFSFISSNNLIVRAGSSSIHGLTFNKTFITWKKKLLEQAAYTLQKWALFLYMLFSLRFKEISMKTSMFSIQWRNNHMHHHSCYCQPTSIHVFHSDQ